MVKTMVRWKTYFDRSRMYVGYIQFYAIGIIFLRSLPCKQYLDSHALVMYPALTIGMTLLALIIGWLDAKIIRNEEFGYLSEVNPMMQEILSEVKKNGCSRIS